MMSLDYGLINVKGKNKQRNEDYHLIASNTITDSSEQITIVAIADGMGGHSQAKQASHIAIEELENLWYRIFETQKKTSLYKIISQIENEIPELLKNIDIKLNENPEDKMGTTLSILLMAEKYYYIAHVGDGRIYLMKDSATKDIFKTQDLEYNNNFNLITEDQSWVSLQIKQNKMTHEEALNHKKSNLIYECLGVKPGVNPLYSFGTYAEGDKFILMTDGVYKNLSIDKIYNLIENEIGNSEKLQSVADKIYDALLGTPLDDDVCFIAINN